MLEIFMSALWVCFTTYATWYFTSAKHYAPITPDDAQILWKIHRRNTQCDGKKWREIKRGDNIIGFECECGYKHIQKRPIVAGTLAPDIDDPEVSTFERLHTSHN